MIKAYKNLSYQRKRSLKRFWKKLWREKEKNPILVYPGLRYTHKLLRKSFCYENHFAVKKTQKNFGSNFKNSLKNFCCRHQKNASHTFSIYMEIVWLAFFLTKNFSFLFSTIHRILSQNKRKVFRKFDDTI